ncbi:hypothetical protein, partial [Kluyvera cryocrescens]|uniref:hypothetical protein n=1 Tax=Kluyvera cryocrescens TaxID=580 RepID=UPI001C3F4E16
GETRRYSSHSWDSPFGPTQAWFNIAPGNFVVSRFASARHPGGLTLSSFLRLTDFKRGLIGSSDTDFNC